MNGSYYQTPVFINDLERQTNNDTYTYKEEQSYIENILRNNIGKHAKVYVSFSDSIDWKDRVFEGIIEHAGRDNIVVRSNDKSYLILMIYLNYVEFDDVIIYAK